MQFLIPLIGAVAAFSFGAFFGSQVDDAIDKPPQAAPINGAINPARIALYGGAALLAYTFAKRKKLI